MATERKIGADVYRCDKLPASEALKLLLRVTKMFQAAPTMMASVAAGSADKTAINAFLVLAMSQDGDGGEVHNLIVELAQICRVGSDPCIVGVKPQGLEDLLQVAWFAMEVNFKDFLAASLADS